MATIQARPGRQGGTRYRVQIRLGTTRASATFPTLAAARRWAAVTEGALRTQRQFPTLEAAHRTLGEVLARYTREVLPTKSPRTAVNQAIHLAWWQAQLGPQRLIELTPARLTACRDRLAQDRAPATVELFLNKIEQGSKVQHKCQRHHPQSQLCDCGRHAPKC